MKKYESRKEVRKVFLCVADNLKVLLIIACVFAIIFGAIYLFKIKTNSKEDPVVSNGVETVSDLQNQINTVWNEKKALEIERNKLLNEANYASKARAVVSYSISKAGLKDIDDIKLFYDSVRNTVNNTNIAVKLSILNRDNDVYSIFCFDTIDINNNVILTFSLVTADNETLNYLEKAVDELIKKEFALYNVSLLETKYHYYDASKLAKLIDEKDIIENKISAHIERVEEISQKKESAELALKKPVVKSKVEFSVKSLVLKMFSGFFLGIVLVIAWNFLKNASSHHVCDIALCSNCFGLQTLAVLDSERIKKNWLTKLFMRKATYSNKDAYGIVSVYLKEKENLSVLSFLDEDKEKEFKAATSAKVVNCNGDLSELFKVIAEKNNFVILIDTETTRTKQVIEVYNFVKNLDLEMYGAVVYTI